MKAVITSILRNRRTESAQLSMNKHTKNRLPNVKIRFLLPHFSFFISNLRTVSDEQGNVFIRIRKGLMEGSKVVGTQLCEITGTFRERR